MDLERQIADAQRTAENERKLWEYWESLSKKYHQNQSLRRWNPRCGDAARAYYDAKYILETTRNIFVAVHALLTMIYQGFWKDLEEIESWFNKFKEIRAAIEKLKIEAELAYIEQDQAFAAYDMMDEYQHGLDRAVMRIDAAADQFRNREIDRTAHR